MISACASTTGDRCAFDQHFHRVLGAEDIVGYRPVFVESHEFECRYVLGEGHVKVVLVQYVYQELGIFQCPGGEELTVSLFVPAWVVTIEVPRPDQVVVVRLRECSNAVLHSCDCGVDGPAFGNASDRCRY